MTQTQADIEPADDRARKGLLSGEQRARLVLMASTVVGFLAVLWVGRTLHIPAYAGHEASLLQQPHAAVSVLAFAGAFVALTVLGSAVTGMVRFDGGVLVAAAALTALSVRGGTIRDVIFRADGEKTVFLTLAIESAILFAMVAICWMGVWQARDRGWLRDREVEKPAGTAVTWGTRLYSLGLQIVVTAALVLLVGQSDVKGQALAAVWVGCYFGTGAAEYAMPTARMGPWQWLGPATVSVLGYLVGGATASGIATADLSGPLAGLARPLPLDYASLGVAGALMGRHSGVNAVKAIVGFVKELGQWLGLA